MSATTPSDAASPKLLAILRDYDLPSAAPENESSSSELSSLSSSRRNTPSPPSSKRKRTIFPYSPLESSPKKSCLAESQSPPPLVATPELFSSEISPPLPTSKWQAQLPWKKIRSTLT
ncbi:hypothetical protein RUND412_000561 [Rhizina undulata]